MATSADYANWLRNNQDKRGTPNYATVLRAYQEAALEESQAAQAPAPVAPTAKPESGFLPALRAGATELGGGISALAGKLGLKDEATAQAEYDAAQKRAREIFAPTEAGWTEAPGTKFLELLGGSVPYMAAPLAAGAAAATLPFTGTAAAATALGAAGLTSAAQFTATNLSRQMEEGKKLAETDLGNAALAAVPQAALDTLSLRLIPGIGRIFGQAGIKVTAENAKEIAEQGLKKALIDYTAATGKTMGAEGLTEAAQQVLERAQAGLNLTDPKAREEYFDSFLGGAVLSGTLAVPGRYYERSKAQGEARTLLEGQEAEQRKAAREAAEAEKKSPEYLLKLDADYQAAVKRMQELQAAVKDKPGKDALPDERVEYQQRVEELKAFTNETMRPLTAEYTPRKAEIAQLKERQRVEGMTPEDYMLEQMGIKVPEATAPATLEEAAAQRETTAPPVAPETTYAQQQLTFAQRQGVTQALNADEQRTLNIAFLMQDPVMAQRLVETKTPIPEVSKKESDAILGGLKLQLQEQAKERAKQERTATQAELQQRQEDLKAQQPKEEADPLALWKASVEQTEDQATEELLRPNFETLRPTGPATVTVAPGITLIQNPTTLLNRLDSLVAARDQAAADADSAFTSGNKELGVKKSQEREAAQTALNNLEQMEGAPRALMSLRKAQDTALMNATQLIDDLKAGRTLGGPEAGTASSTPQTLINQINRERDAFITSAVQEAAATRRLFAKALPQEEATKAANQIRDVFNEWVTRSMAQPRREVLEERVTAPAQMRGTEVVRGAETELVDPRPLEERRFGAYKAATQVLQEQLQDIAAKLKQVPRAPQRVEPTLKMQFPETEAAKVAEAKGETAQTLEGQLRRRRDYAQGLIDQAFQTRKVPGIAETLLTRAQDFLPRGTTGLLEAVENVADRIIRGQNVERSDLRTLRDELRAASARPGEAEVAGERVGQRELFPAEERRALAPKEERGALGLIREKPEAFQAVRAKEAAKAARVAAATQRSEQLTQDIRKELDRIDKERQAALEQRVEERRDSLQSAWQSAVKKAKNLVLSARKAAQKPQIDALKKEIDAIRKGGIEGLNKEAIDRLLAARAELDKLSGEFDTVVEAAEFLPIAQANKWVAYERGAVEQAEKALAETRTPQTVSAVQQQQAALQRAEQARLQSLKGEEKAAEAARMRAAQTGLGLPGQRRVEGRVERIEPEQTAAQRAAEAQEARAQAREESARRAAAREAERTELEQRVLDLGTQVAEREAAQKRARTPESKAKIQAEIDALTKDVTLAQGQLDALGETKPRKKGPAMVPTGAALAKQKPLRTGYRKALEAASESLRREREGKERGQAAPWFATTPSSVYEREETIDVGGVKIQLSRGATANPSTTGTVRTELKQTFPDLGRVQIYDSVDALVAANPQYKGKIPADARGFVDSAGNKAFLIAENINQGQALSVLLHEVGAHVGLKSMLGDAQYSALVNAVKSWEKRTDNSPEARVAQAARARVEAAETPAGQVNDELLAYAIEEAVNAGVKPMETKGVLGQWLSRVAALFRRALEKFGLPPKALDAQGLVDMAFGAAKMEMQRAAKTRMYHGSPNAQLKELRGLTFVTPDKQTAEQYARGEVAFTGRTEGSGGRVYEVEVDTTDALDFNKPEHRAAYERARKQWNEGRDSDERLPAFTSPGFISSKTGYPSYGRIADILAAMPAFDSVFVDEGSQGFSLAVRDGRTLAAQKGTPASEDFMPTPKPPSGPAFKTRILPDGTRQQVLRPAAKPEGLPRIEEGRSDSDFYKVTGFQPDASAPFHKMTLAEAARFGASKARGQRKELFTRLADLFDEATTPEKQGLVLATNGKPSNAAAYGAFYRNSNVVFSPGIKQTGYLETLLHELTHAASSYALSVDKRLAGRVESLRRKAEAWAETKEGKAYIRKHAMFLVAKDQQGNRGIYGLKNIDEFLSELYADREFQKFLTQIPSDAPKKNLLTRFVEFMSSFFSAPDQAQQSLFAEAVALSEEVLETTRREIYGTDIELSEVRRSKLPFGIEGPPDVAFSTKMPTAARVANQLVGKEKGVIDKIRDNFLGIGGRAQFIDKYFPTEEALKRAGADPTKAMQAMYYLRMYDQRMHFTSQAITDGVPERREIVRRDGTKEYLIEAKPGANLKQAYDILKRKDVVKEAGSADAANKLVTLYMAAIRGENKGYETLNFGRVWAQGEIKRIENELKSTKLSAEQRTVLTKRMNNLGQRLDSMPTPEDIKTAKAEIDANPVLRDAFSEVRDIYNQYNRDLINFNVQTGALSKEQANKLLQENDYIPYYRMRDGVAELIIGKETPIRIGNLKDSPHLQDLVGGDEPIMDFITSSIQNTSMLIDMATHNLAMKNLMFEFKDLGLATVGKVKGGNAPTGAVTFKLDGVEHFGVVDTEALGISSDLLVKGLAGIPTMFPAFVRVMGMPARFLRRMIVASPLYMARQLFRDSLAASIASGSNTVPVLSALKQIGKAGALERRGITGGQVFTGMPEDQARMIKDMQAGKLSITNGLAYLEGKAAQVDALTRRSQYDDYIKQGLSEMEATYMALESMNFSRRGLSPSMHMASTLIPFFNAQIQGLDVLYRSFRGQMPMNERLGVRKKLIARGMMLFGLSIAYAMAMQDDEAYKNAKPEEKYGNWFVSLPGVEQPLRLPIPFELGYIFKALPEAIVNTLANEEGGEEALKALKHIVQQMIPGGSSYMIPAAVKPLLEVGFGVSAYTGRDIESAREQAIEPGYRARESTTELAKTVGEMTGFSPIKLEFLISGYTGQMGMALISALSAPFAGTGEGPAPATKRPSDLPLVGTLFQPKDASGIIDLVYERMNKVRQVQETYKRMLAENKPEQAKRYAEEKADELSLASVAGAFREQMGQITEFERQVRASTLTPDRKRAELDRARQAKIRLAQAVQGLSGRTAPQAARP